MLNIWLKSRLPVFISGLLIGMALVIIVAAWVAYRVPGWLVVEDKAHQADIAVVLGGGGGSRLRKGLALYDAGLVGQLVLVDKKKRSWKHIQEQLCPDCKTAGKDVVILDGSVNTFTDASLVARYCIKHEVDSILVVTDPYHSRRALLIFDAEFEDTGVTVSVVNSGDYVGKLSPHDKWWQDNHTVKAIWSEISKILFMHIMAR